MEECEECVFDVLVPEVKRVTLALTLVAKSATKFKIKYSIGHDLLSLHSYNDQRLIRLQKWEMFCNFDR